MERDGERVGSGVANEGMSVLDRTEGESDVVELVELEGIVGVESEGATGSREALGAPRPRDGCAVGMDPALEGNEEGAGDGPSATCQACKIPA